MKDCRRSVFGSSAIYWQRPASSFPERDENNMLGTSSGGARAQVFAHEYARVCILCLRHTRDSATAASF